MLWTLLTVLCAIMPVASAFASAEHAHASVSGYAVSITAGLILSLIFVVILSNLAEFATKLALRLRSEARREWFVRALYFSTAGWIVLSGFLGGAVSSALLRFYRMTRE